MSFSNSRCGALAMNVAETKNNIAVRDHAVRERTGLPLAPRFPRIMSRLNTAQQSRCLPSIALACAIAIFSHAGVHGQRGLDPLRLFEQEARTNAQGYSWLKWSTEHIGHRLTGTANGARAEETADSLFRLSRLPVVGYSPFTATAWTRGSVMLSVRSGFALEHFASVALAHSPDSASLDAVLLDVGNGLTEDLERIADLVPGRAVLMNLGLVAAPSGTPNLHRSEKAALAIRYGASAIVFVNNVEGGILLTGTASVNGSAIPIPAVCITSEEGGALRGRLAAGEALSVQIKMNNRSGPVEARNVVAEIPGTRWPEEVILVGGHLDSWDLATGATDNGLGSYSVLDIARAMVASGVRPARTVRFVLFMGEEQGLLGSEALVAQYSRAGELANVRCMINLDMTGDPFGFCAVGPEGWTAVVDSAMAAIHSMDTAFRAELKDRPGLHSDHQSFLLAGVPVITPLSDLGGHVYGCYHSSCDDVHLVDPMDMVNNARIVGMLALYLANTPILPGAFQEDALGARLKTAGLEESLRLAGLWRW
ncbi:MAG: M28 family peptidase [Flavobacteriales bacterium]|nr:M28 family peptidase [Flavobacteriales bacterium]